VGKKSNSEIMVTNNQIIESDGKRYRVQLVEIVTPTYEMALEDGYIMNEKDLRSQTAYGKLKILEHFYNNGKEGDRCIYFSDEFGVSSGKGIFNFKDFATAQKFIEEQRELLNIFYQI
jgi:hypothetical protein